LKDWSSFDRIVAIEFGWSFLVHPVWQQWGGGIRNRRYQTSSSRPWARFGSVLLWVSQVGPIRRGVCQILLPVVESLNIPINNRLQGSVATHLRCGEFLNNKLRKVYCCYKQERDWLVHSAHLANTLQEDEESTRDNHVLACSFLSNIYRF